MKIYVYAEPSFRDSLWCGGVLKGIGEEAAKKRYGVEYIADVSDLVPENQDGLKNGEGRWEKRIVIMIGTTVTGLPDAIRRFQSVGFQVILINYQSDSYEYTVNKVIMDYADAIKRCVSYLSRCGKKRIALFGINVNSSTDRIKDKTYIAHMKSLGAAAPEDDVFYNNASLDACISDFCEKADGYEAVICANDVAGISLILALNKRGILIPCDMYAVSFGDLMFTQLFSSLFTPGITTVSVDHAELGRQAVALYSFMSKNTADVSVTLTLKSELTVRSSTGGVPYDKDEKYRGCVSCENQDIDFYSDPKVWEILNFENFISKCETLDFGVISGLLAGRTQAQIADALYISETAVAYRIKRMCSILGCENRRDMLDITEKYIKADVLRSFLSGKTRLL